ncbi:MAG: hypothetical protein HY244_16550 [Rhizobiales bacterium]|nr:hypothetical protein [Hyphomicrobiales bacterium]
MSDIDFERERDVAKIIMEEAQRTHDREAGLHRTFLEAASKSAEVTVKTSIIVNGGAAVAILAFIGGLVGKDVVGIKQVTDITSSLMWFASGVASGVGALAFIYLTNYCAAARVGFRKRIFQAPYVVDTGLSTFLRNLYTASHVIAVVMSLASLFLFIWGMIDVRASIVGLSTQKTPSSIQAPK